MANVGIIPAQVFAAGVRPGVPVGHAHVQIGKELADAGLGNSTIVGIGGDPIVGMSFIDVLERFEADPDTELVVMVGEIGGDEEEKAGAYIASTCQTPVVAYIAGFQAPPGKTMGHAGAIISGSAGTAQAKKDALEAAACGSGRAPPRPPGWRSRRLGEDVQSMSRIPFTRGVPSADLLPVADLSGRRSGARADAAGALAYAPSGYLRLREWIGERHGVDPARMLLSNGSLEGVGLLAQHLFAPRRRGRRGGSDLRPHPDLPAPPAPRWCRAARADGVDVDALERRSTAARAGCST